MDETRRKTGTGPEVGNAGVRAPRTIDAPDLLDRTVAQVITDIRAMYAHAEVAHLDVVKDLKHYARGGALDEIRISGLQEALEMRRTLAEHGIDPHAVKADATQDEREAAISYLEHLAQLRGARLTAPTLRG